MRGVLVCRAREMFADHALLAYATPCVFNNLGGAGPGSKHRSDAGREKK